MVFTYLFALYALAEYDAKNDAIFIIHSKSVRN